MSAKRPAVAMAVALAFAGCGTEEWRFNDTPAGNPEGATGPNDAPDAYAEVDGDDGGACDPANNRCGPSCGGGQACPQNAPTCLQPYAFCAPCREDQDCAMVRFGPICDTHTGECVPPCMSDRSCPSGHPYCDRQSGHCVRCLDDDDCPPGYSCDPSSHTC